MNKSLIIIILALSFTFQANAQQGGKERIKAYKTAYITEQLDLSASEAEKFWPVYNEFDKKLYSLKVEKVRKERRRIKEMGGPENLSDSEASAFVFSMLSAEKEASVTRELMYTELSKVLSPVKLMKLYNAERNFNKRLLMEYKKRKPDDKIK